MGFDFYVPASSGGRATHVGIGAHQDDLEFMAFHGIKECYGNPDRHFGGVICTNGAGSSRTGAFKDLTDEDIQRMRESEQRLAADIGGYAFVAQLRYPSAEIRTPLQSPLVEDLVEILSEHRPGVIYTHNPADKHPTHVRVLVAVIEAIRRMPAGARPQALFGCEMWRGLDWMADDAKIVQDVTGFDALATKLNNVFETQIAGGKRYDLAVMGRRRANATLFDSHTTDQISEAIYAMDLSPLIGKPVSELPAFTTAHIDTFRDDVCSLLNQTI